MLKKDGEIKVLVPKKDGAKTASGEDEKVRYTVDDLVKDSEEKEEQGE